MASFGNLAERYLNAKRALFEKYYKNLNEMQREAVFTANGPLLVLAGAGSGKTTVLVNRITFLMKYGNGYYSEYIPHDLDEGKVAELERSAKEGVVEESTLLQFASAPCKPYSILAITFTNKAANEIKNRLAAAMSENEDPKSIWAGTFHSVCMRILRVHGEKLGYREGFTVYDTDDSKKAISAAIKALKIDEKVLPVKAVMNEIGRAKDSLMTPERYAEECGVDFRRKQIAEVYKKYAEMLKASNALDFDDIIMQTVMLLISNSEVREYYQNKFRYISVDEFQDTNKAQFTLIMLLCGVNNNIMVVGDDDQSIYKFRGAVIENILGFEKALPGVKTVKLEQNYRSTGTILNAANAVISQNVGRHGKKLWTDKQSGEKIFLKLCDDQNTEARYLVDKIAALTRNGEFTFRDCAILYRTNAQSNIIERTFAKSGLPYRMLGGLRFNDRKEIRDVVAYLQFIVNPADAERMKRIINEPKRGIGGMTVSAVITLAEETGMSVFEVMKNASGFAAFSKGTSVKLESFAEFISSMRSLLSSDISLEAFVKLVVERSGYMQMLIDGGQEEKERIENVEEFISGIIDYENANEAPTLVGFLEENALVSDVDKYDEDADAVVMMTIHSAKGLEFPVVFLPGMEEGLFPGQQTLASGPDELEEERRLAYVAITRAKKRLFISHTKNRMLYGRTSYNPISRFAKEIPEELINVEDPPVARYAQNGTKTYISAGEVQKTPVQKKPQVGVGLFAPQKTAEKGDMTLSAGDRVRHMSFGEGEIISARSMGADVLYEVAFDKVGTKKLMATYAKLKKI